MDKVIQIAVEPSNNRILITALTANGKIWTGGGIPSTFLTAQADTELRQPMLWAEVDLPPGCEKEKE